MLLLSKFEVLKNTLILREWLTEEFNDDSRQDKKNKRYISVTKEADHKHFEQQQKGLGQSLTIIIYENDDSLKCANFPISICPVGDHETGAKDNAALIQKVLKENKMEKIAKELF